MAILFCNDLVPTSGQATALRESGRRPVPPLLDLPGAGAASPSDDSAGSADDGQLAEVVPSKTAPEISQADWLHGSATRKAVSLSSRGPPRRVMPAALPSVAAPFSARARAAREPAAEECGVVYDALWEDWSEWLRPVAKHPAPGGGSARASASSSVAAKAGGRPRMGVTLPSLLSREESATGSSFWPRSAAAGSLSLRSATSEAQWRRPGSQLTGRLAMADSSSLPQQYSLICKEDVTRASSRRDVDSRSAAARRRDCAAQQGRLHRKRAARWRGRAGDLTAGSSQSLAPEPPFPGQDDQEDQLQDELEGDASSAQDGYPRWKRAFDRIQQRSPAEGPAAGPSAARDAAASRQPERAAPWRSDPRPRSRSTSKGRSGSKGDSVHRSPDRGEEARRPSRGMPPSAAAASLAMSSVGGSRARADSAADIANSFISSALSNKNLAWKKRHVSLDSHIESLSRMKKIEERVSKLQRIHDARKRHFFQLPEEERELYQTVFMYTNGYTDPHDCTLDAASVRVCAVEVGLGGIGSEEQVAVLNACEQAARSPQQITCAASQGVEQDSSTPLADIKTGVTLYTFACVLVPALRRALHALRAERLEDLFDDRDVDHSGSLAMDACCDLVRVFAGSRADAATVREHAAVMFAESPPEEHGLRRVSMEVLRGAKNNRPGGTFSSVAKAAAGRKSQLPEPPRVLNSEQLGRLVDEVCEATRRRCHQQERHLQAQAHLDGATFAATRPDLPLLQRIYQRHAGRDADQEEASAGLTVDGCLQVLLEFGLRGSGMRLDAVMHLVEQHVGRQGEGLIHFKGLLDLVEQVRRRCEHTDFEPLEDRFVRFAAVESRTASAEAALAAPIDRRESGSRSTASGPAPRHIPLVSVAKFVDQTRCLPRRRELPDAVAQVVEEHLTYSTSTLTGGDADVPHGTIHFPAMVRLLQRVSEYVGRLEFQREAKAARDHGFQPTDLAQLHTIFDSLDDDCSGNLNKAEVWEALKSLDLCSKMTGPTYDIVFRHCDTDGSGCVDFIEFLGLLGLARDKVGFFSNNRAIARVTDLRQTEVERILGFFGRLGGGSEDEEEATRFIVHRDKGTDVFESPESWAVLRHLKKGDVVTGVGDPKWVDGYLLQPIAPNGLVETEFLTKAAGKQLLRRKRGNEDTEEEEPPSHEHLQELCSCLGLTLTSPLIDACGVENVKDLFAYALARLGERDDDDDDD